jgi:peptidoglycan/LPS O-acetylase OafA/YrhL
VSQPAARLDLTRKQPREAGAHVRELDGIRGLAILAVVIYHFADFSPVGGLQAAVWTVSKLGWCGVDLFFVLSGFLITGVLIDTRECPEYFKSFYGRRMLRIFPLYYAFLLLYFHGALPLAHALGKWPEITTEAEGWFWLYLQNWKAVMGYEPLNITHFWSLAVEEQFYLVWPAVVYFALRRRLLWICVGMAAMGLALRCIWQTHPNGGTVLYMATVMRMDTLAFGALAAVLVRDGRFRETLRGLVGAMTVVTGGGFAALFVVLFVTGRRNDQGAPYIRTWGYSLLAATFACLVIYCVLNAGTKNRVCVLMRSGVLTRLGKYSYCIYVVHMLIAYFFKKAERTVAAMLGPSFNIPLSCLTEVAGLAASFGVALISWNLLEKRCLALKRYFPYSKP